MNSTAKTDLQVVRAVDEMKTIEKEVHRPAREVRKALSSRAAFAQAGLPPGVSMRTVPVDTLICYVRYLVNNIQKALSAGYDWDVVSRMTRTNISRERYNSLVNR